VRPFYYYHSPGKGFVLASKSSSAYATCSQGSERGQAIVTELQGIDRTGTFFLSTARLPLADLRLVSDGHSAPMNTGIHC